MLWIGVDVGGTFTDLVLYDSVSKQIRIEKVSSTSSNQALGILAGMAGLGLEPAAVGRIAHGSTVATNVALERSGSHITLMTTRGFRDVVEIGRGERLKMYDARSGRGTPIVPRSSVLEIDERVSADGSVLKAPSLAQLDELLDAKQLDPEAIAVCFLHSYRNPSHERMVAEHLKGRFPIAFVTCSSEVVGEPKEYERFATTALNAYVAPRMRTYLLSLKSQLDESGFKGLLDIMTSNGGTASVERATQLPAATIMSGPAAGVTGALHWAAECDLGDIITFDMGGTSTDTCLIKDNAISLTGETSISGLISKMPQIEINSVGSGGGSIASVGPGGFLTIGPESAGSNPGPACYGRGGEQATVTDANLVIGRIGATKPLGRDIQLSLETAERAVRRLADQLAINVQEMAEGIVRLAVARTTSAIREISVMRGHDPRDFTLFAFGGAGPLHGALVADELEIPRVVIPPYPGNFSAFGLLTADSRAERSVPINRPLTVTSRQFLDQLVEKLAEECRGKVEEDGTSEAAIACTASVDLRYARQASYLNIVLPDGGIESGELEAMFGREYQRQFSHLHTDPVELCNVRVSAVRRRPKPRLGSADKAATSQPVGSRSVVFAGETYQAPIYDRNSLPTESPIAGSCIIEEYGATCFVPPHYVCRVDSFDNLILERRT